MSWQSILAKVEVRENVLGQPDLAAWCNLQTFEMEDAAIGVTTQGKPAR